MYSHTHMRKVDDPVSEILLKFINKFIYVQVPTK